MVGNSIEKLYAEILRARPGMTHENAIRFIHGVGGQAKNGVERKRRVAEALNLLRRGAGRGAGLVGQGAGMGLRAPNRSIRRGFLGLGQRVAAFGGKRLNSKIGKLNALNKNNNNKIKMLEYKKAEELITLARKYHLMENALRAAINKRRAEREMLTNASGKKQLIGANMQSRRNAIKYSNPFFR